MHDIFYFTDIHGHYELYRAVMDYCHEQDPEATIVYGGDACDRGPYGYNIMKELLKNPYIIYLKGNHEDMFVQSARTILKEYRDPLDTQHVVDYLNKSNNSNVILSIANGSFITLYDWMMDGMPNDFINKINDLPLTFSYGKIDFCHAGGNPKIFTRVSDIEYEGEYPNEKDIEMILWDRNWLGFGWIPNRICIFGHTPTVYLPAKYYGQDKSVANSHPCKYVGLIDERLSGYRLDMDCATIYSNKVYVLNCLTMQAQGFEMKNDETKKIEVIQL